MITTERELDFYAVRENATYGSLIFKAALLAQGWRLDLKAARRREDVLEPEEQIER